MDLETARNNMIEQQIRAWNVLEMQTLNALGEIRREDFVPEQYRDLAFADVQIPLGEGDVMLEPKVSARMVESLGLEPGHRVLEIGTGSGYVTALLALLSAHVTSLDIRADLSGQAGRNLAMAAIDNVELVVGDCFQWCKDNVPGPTGEDNGDPGFDRMLVTGSCPELDDSLCRMIKPDGKLVAIVGHDPAMQVVVRDGGGETTSLFETSAPRLHNVVDTPVFNF